MTYRFEAALGTNLWRMCLVCVLGLGVRLGMVWLGVCWEEYLVVDSNLLRAKLHPNGQVMDGRELVVAKAE